MGIFYLSLASICSLLCILCYRLNKSTQTVIVPSFFLIKNFKEKKVHGKVKYPPRLILELLFISLLSFGIYKLAKKNTEKDVLVIINNSESMSAQVSDNKKTRLDQAKELFTNNIKSAYRYKIISNPQFSLTNVNEYLGYNEALAKVNEIAPSTLPDTLSTSIEKIVAESNPDLVEIYSDKKIILNSEQENLIIKNYYVGGVMPNTYISEVKSTVSSQGVSNLQLTFGFSGEGSTNIVYEIISLTENKKLIDKKELKVSAEYPSTISIDLKDNQSAIYQISIKNLLHSDAIASDNTVFYAQEKQVGKNINLISDIDEQSKLEIKQNIDSTLQGKVILSSFDKIEQAKNTIDIFYKTNFPEKIKNPSLIILPQASSDLLTLQNVLQQSSITSWDKLNQLTRYVNFEGLTIPRSIVFNLPNWGNGVIYNRSGPIYLSGIISGQKVIVSGFELLPFDRNRHAASDILLLNSLTDLQAKDSSFRSNLVLKENFNDIKCLTDAFECNLPKVYLEKGVYKNTQGLIVVNNINPIESQTFEEKNLLIDERSISQNEILDKNKKNIPVEIFAALILLVVDLLLIATKKKEVNWSDLYVQSK